MDGAPVGLTAYNINGNNYFKLRDLAALLNGTQAQFQVGWNDAARTITLTTDAAYTASNRNAFQVGTTAERFLQYTCNTIGNYNSS